MQREHVEVIEQLLGHRHRINDGDVEKAQGLLQGLANKHSEQIDEWTGKGCNGPRPEPPFKLHAEMEAQLHRAIWSRSQSKIAADTLDVREADARRELSAVTARLREAVIRQIGFELGEQADAILSLREQLAELEASLLGGHDFARALDDEIYERTGKRVPAFHFWSGFEGLPGDAFSRGPADPASVRQWRDRFDALVKGD